MIKVYFAKDLKIEDNELDENLIKYNISNYQNIIGGVIPTNNISFYFLYKPTINSSQFINENERR